MRAYLSTGAGHAEDGSRYVCGLNVESAMAEARAILADVEPETPYIRAWPYSDAWHVPASHRDVYGRPVEAQAALAEALAGFIGAEV